MKLTHRCPKCQGTRLLRTHLRREQVVATSEWGLQPRDGWYEEWVCSSCRFSEQYRLEAMPATLVVDEPVSGPTESGPYR